MLQYVHRSVPTESFIFASFRHSVSLALDAYPKSEHSRVSQSHAADRSHRLVYLFFLGCVSRTPTHHGLLGIFKTDWDQDLPPETHKLEDFHYLVITAFLFKCQRSLNM